MSTWKQPIPTDLVNLTGGNKFAANVFGFLLLRASNSDTTVYIEGTPISVKRGECVCGRYELAECFGLERNESMRIARILEKLEKSFQLVSKRKSKNCSVITIKNYDEIVYKDKVFCTNQDVVNYTVNKDEYVANATNNDFIIYE